MNEDQTLLCACGGEMYLDSYDHPKRPVKWLMRCQWCGKVAPVSGSHEESLAAWYKGVKSDAG